MLEPIYARHEKVALMFSGGKDSIACLLLARPFLDRTFVIWINTGANFPEINAFMAKVRVSVPHVIEIKTDQPQSLARHGHPVDVLPVNYTGMGQASTSKKDLLLRSYLDCCAENIWLPADSAARALGVTAILRGQRKSESHTAPWKSGEAYEGIDYIFPIEDWSDAQVLDYLKAQGLVLEERLHMSHSSLDCWNCTAYCAHSKERLAYIKKHHPEKFDDIAALLRRINQAVRQEQEAVMDALGD